MLGNRKDPLADVVKKVMDLNENERRIIAEFNSEIGIKDRRQLPHEKRAAYDQALSERLNEATSPENYSAKQKQLAANAGDPKKIDAPDLKKVRMQGHIEEEGSVPTTAREKDLAAMKPPHDKITHADVLKGRGVIKQEEKEYKGDEAPFEADEKKSTPWTNPQRKAKNLAREMMKQMKAKKEKKIDENENKQHVVVLADHTGKRHEINVSAKNKVHAIYLAKQKWGETRSAEPRLIGIKKEKQIDEWTKEQSNVKKAAKIIRKRSGYSIPASVNIADVKTKGGTKKLKEEVEHIDENALASIQEEIRTSLLEKAHWLRENGTQEQVVEFLNNLTMEQREILNLAEAGPPNLNLPDPMDKLKRPFIQPPGTPKTPTYDDAKEFPGNMDYRKDASHQSYLTHEPKNVADMRGVAMNPNTSKQDAKDALRDAKYVSSNIDRVKFANALSTAHDVKTAAPGFTKDVAGLAGVPSTPKGFADTQSSSTSTPAPAPKPAAPTPSTSSVDTSGGSRYGKGGGLEYADRHQVYESKSGKSLEKFLKEDFNGKKS